MSRPRVLLAEDNISVAVQISELLEEAFDVVGVVSSSEELESAFERLAPDVVVTDIVMPREGGLAAARHILEQHPGARFVFLTFLDTPSMIRMSVSEGVRGYVVKEDAADELIPAVGAALAGRGYVSAAGRRALSPERQ